jgi:hypothetical protein
MKKNYLIIALTLILSVSFAQTKTSGLVTLGGSVKVKIDKNSTNSTITMTLVGPSDRWFAIGLDASSMTAGTDCIYYTTTFFDGKLNGFSAPSPDSINNWTIVSNTPTSGLITIVATRAFFTGDTNDYTFEYLPNSLNVIYAYGASASTTISQHSGSTRGSTTLNFTALDATEFESLKSISISPNPSTGLFTISKNNTLPISKIKVFDTNAKLIKEFDFDAVNQETTIDISELSKGIYFLEISNDTDKEVRKIGLN